MLVNIVKNSLVGIALSMAVVTSTANEFMTDNNSIIDKTTVRDGNTLAKQSREFKTAFQNMSESEVVAACQQYIAEGSLNRDYILKVLKGSSCLDYARDNAVGMRQQR